MAVGRVTLPGVVEINLPVSLVGLVGEALEEIVIEEMLVSAALEAAVGEEMLMGEALEELVIKEMLVDKALEEVVIKEMLQIVAKVNRVCIMGGGDSMKEVGQEMLDVVI